MAFFRLSALLVCCSIVLLCACTRVRRVVPGTFAPLSIDNATNSKTMVAKLSGFWEWLGEDTNVVGINPCAASLSPSLSLSLSQTHGAML